MDQFEKFSASELYCPRCRSSQPVYERLLLVLPSAEIFDIRCRQCGTSLGQREARGASLSAQMARPTRPNPSKRPAAPRRLKA
ncbi:MAG: cytoplasmic protein [Kiritimatiellae bacterium]|nr:cytoplasmic protein [Kiritimatiellia bacterium]MCO6400798.1 cytoplasmic protein [Verrucomicrobiota bacterium]